jgi:glycosyltransferase involved in cell wall biosynthesis
MGPLAVYRDALASLAREYGGQFEIVALVHRRDLFDTEGVTYLEFPQVAASWLARLRFEYWSSKEISLWCRPQLWLALHDITPNVTAEVRAVYCHNPASFYRLHPSEFFADGKFVLFRLFYRFLYRINIHANDYVIVQQDWMRKNFIQLYALRNVVVAHPAVTLAGAGQSSIGRADGRPYRFFYPAFPRTFKNLEVCLRAARILERRGFTEFELWLTVAASVNAYGSRMVKEFSDLQSVRWLGLLPRDRVFQLYGDVDCLLFASRLETWGMPITEFRCFNKPILAADLPYARETAAGHDWVQFFDPDDPALLADLLQQAATGQSIFTKAPEIAIAPPFARNWSELWALLLHDLPH